jgi:hypothetical protein
MEKNLGKTRKDMAKVFEGMFQNNLFTYVMLEFQIMKDWLGLSQNYL